MTRLHRSALKAAKKAEKADEAARDAHKVYQKAVSHCNWEHVSDLWRAHQVAEQAATAAFEEARLAFAAPDDVSQTPGLHIECVTLSNGRATYNVLVPDGPDPAQWIVFYARDRTHAEALFYHIGLCPSICTTHKAVTP